jgi:hypothetical protein
MKKTKRTKLTGITGPAWKQYQDNEFVGLHREGPGPLIGWTVAVTGVEVAREYMARLGPPGLAEALEKVRDWMGENGPLGVHREDRTLELTELLDEVASN